MITRENPVVDQDDLHNEAVIVSYLIMEVGVDVANKTADRDHLFSKMARRLRRDDPKISQSKLESQIKENDEYIEMERDLNILKSQLEGLKVVVKEIGILAELFHDGYWSSNMNPRDRRVRRIIDEVRTKEQEKRQKDVLNNKYRGEKKDES